MPRILILAKRARQVNPNPLFSLELVGHIFYKLNPEIADYRVTLFIREVMRITVTLLIGLCLSVFCLSGCRTQGDGGNGETIRLSLLPSGQLATGGGIEIPKTQLAKWLGKQGATRQTIIIIQIQDQTKLEEVSSLTQTLASAGYRYVYFKRPQRAKASVVAPSP